MEIYDTPAAAGSESFEPKGHDIVFDKVSFSYGDELVLDHVSFTAKEGEVTALVIAHRMRTVESADKIIVLKDGHVAEEGTPKELKEKEGSIFRHMLELQTESAVWSI